VFSSTSQRRPATLVAWAADDDEELALLRIDPFPDMPCLPGIAPDIGVPELGSDVFLLGFPLGNQALQEGRQVIASTFRGIVSRSVGSYLQVDAAVHPGQSGGPAIDAEGRVIGLVTAMQAVDAVAGSSAIGFITPIAAVAKIWPPPQ
jgi:S1-C subfamily serine protease